MTPCEMFEKLRPAKEIIANEINIEFDSILEVGCQWGENLLAIERKFPDKKIVGVDIDRIRLSEGQKYLTKAELTYGDARKLPFPDKSFDIVFTNALICMLDPEDVMVAIKEILRVAKKQVMFIELLMLNGFIGIIPHGRTAVNWKVIFENNPTIKKLEPEEFDADPWIEYGYLIKLKL